VRAAEAAARAADLQVQQARLAVERLRADAAGPEKQLQHLDELRTEAQAAAEAAREALADAGFDARQTSDAKRLLERVAGELDRLRRAKAERDRIDADRKALDGERGQTETALATARAQAQEALARLEELRERQARAQQSLDSARQALLARARKEGWGALEEPLSGRDELDALDQQLAALQAELTRASNAAVRLLGETERMQRDIARAAELQERKKGLDEEAALAGQLAQHLQANQFIAYVQEEALSVLAADGSRHLLALSQGRYSLGCSDQDFHVVDHWNADRERSVKTLSGGETFLASLALALALAERLADLAAEGRAGDRLESLFLDEGFGTLDAETLDLVVQAIETLQGGNRVVGVVTHINELAERLPARVVVSGGQGVPAALSIAS
jgi:DNA repair protein SbcC/Rad50